MLCPPAPADVRGLSAHGAKGGQQRMVLLLGVHAAFTGDSAVTVTAATELQEQLRGICVHPENRGTKHCD